MPISMTMVLAVWSLSLAPASDCVSTVELSLHRTIHHDLFDQPIDLIASPRSRPADVWCEPDADLEEEETGEEFSDIFFATGSDVPFDASGLGRRRPILRDRTVPLFFPRSRILRC
jgi:hypothetical protein